MLLHEWRQMMTDESLWRQAISILMLGAD